MNVVIITITTLTVTVIFFWWLKKLLEARNSILIKIPGHSLSPISGLFHAFRSVDFFKQWRHNYEKYGTIYRTYSINCVPYIECSDPDVLHYILMTNSKNFTHCPLGSDEAFRHVVGDNSIFLLHGDAHRLHRSLMSSAFRPYSIKRYLPAMVDCTNRLIDQFDNLLTNSESGQLVVDIKKHFSQVTLNVIGLAGFGLDLDCIGKTSPVAESIEDILGAGDWFMLTLIPGVTALVNKFQFVCSLFSSKISKYEIGVRKSRQIVKQIIGMKRQTMAEWIGSEASLLDFILSASSPEKGLSNEELLDQLMSFILAGHETSCLALTYSIFFLSKYKTWQSRCRREVNKVLGKDARLSWEMLPALKTLKAVVNESLRLYMPAPVVLRQSIDDDYLKEHFIPAGTNIGIIIGQMHRLPEYWPEPDEFKPERFLENDSEMANSKAFLPFGDGPLKCIGYQFAMTEILAVLTMLLHRFVFELRSSEEMQCFLTVVLEPKYPVMLKIRKAEENE